MKIEQDTITINDILDLKKNKMLTVNPEYQRGAVWNDTMKKKLIDSILRGYPIPLIYLHHIERNVAGMKREDLEVIDGQQRINALYEFKEGVFKLFDPIADEKKARFPNFIKDSPCSWGGRNFDSLSPEFKTKFTETKLPIVRIETDNSNEARDLFIRLQAGLPLNPQEKRDAWPGGFTEFVLRCGGKSEITRHPGHDFFRRLIGSNSANSRGKARQLCAQMVMLFIEKRKDASWIDIGAQSIDDYYYKNLDFDPNSKVAERFKKALDTIVNQLGDNKRRRLKGHEAIHLVLFVDSLMDDYTSTWEKKLADGFDKFMQLVNKDKETKYASSPGEFWTKYDSLTRTDSSSARTIMHRHNFFSKKMFEFMSPLQPKDPKRFFGQVERELIYFRDDKLCKECGSEITWSELEIHHVQTHAAGGRTELENGWAVHKSCHPR